MLVLTAAAKDSGVASMLGLAALQEARGGAHVPVLAAATTTAAAVPSKGVCVCSPTALFLDFTLHLYFLILCFISLWYIMLYCMT